MFAQRAKEIKNKAVVNEENTDSEYWKKKFLALVEKTSKQKAAPDSEMVVD